MTVRSLLRVSPLAALAVVTACADRAPVGPTANPSFSHTGDPPPYDVLGHWTLCKNGTPASFEVSVNGGAATTVTLAAGQCTDVATTPVSGGLAAVTVTETVNPATMVLDSIRIDTLVVNGGPGSRTLTGTNTYSKTINGDVGVKVTFYNRPILPPPPGGGEGCTPGYWKQDHHFDSWPSAYTPTMQFSAVFENAFPGMTLLQVLGQGGGGLKALGRHTVAALLNGGSSGVSYDLTAQQVINAFNAVFPGGDYEGQKNMFATFNEQGCPLN